MEVEARMFGEPVFNFLFLVGRVVVGNAVNVQLFGVLRSMALRNFRNS